MFTNKPRSDVLLCWIALILTSGEFGLALFAIFNNGHCWELYLAVTYWIRETKGGQHYHDIVVRAVRSIYFDVRKHLPHDRGAEAPTEQTSASVAER